ncbi:MAG: biotin/lipoyl-binding protein, partial [Casimicrobiaceae bacterium]
MKWSLALALPALLVACSEAPPAGYPGYVEADYVRVAAPLSGSLSKLSVKKGDPVAAGAPLFVLESVHEAAARAEAESRVRKAQSTLADLEKAKRPPEVAAVRAQLAQAQAALK